MSYNTSNLQETGTLMQDVFLQDIGLPDPGEGVKVFQINSAKPIQHRWDTFAYFMENWSDVVRQYIKEYQALVLDRHKSPIFLITYEPSGSLDTFEIENLFKIAKSLPHSSKVIVGRNNPGKAVQPDEQEFAIADEIDRVGAEFKLPVLNQVIVSPNKMFYFKSDSNGHHTEAEAKKTSPKRDRLKIYTAKAK